jgi:hypothetical protein
LRGFRLRPARPREARFSSAWTSSGHVVATTAYWLAQRVATCRVRSRRVTSRVGVATASRSSLRVLIRSRRRSASVAPRRMNPWSRSDVADAGGPRMARTWTPRSPFLLGRRFSPKAPGGLGDERRHTNCRCFDVRWVRAALGAISSPPLRTDRSPLRPSASGMSRSCAGWRAGFRPPRFASTRVKVFRGEPHDTTVFESGRVGPPQSRSVASLT